MLKILTEDGLETISETIRDINIISDSIKIRNRLLNGSYNVQQIGDSLKNFEVLTYSDLTEYKRLNDAYDVDEILVLKWGTDTYEVILKTNPVGNTILQGETPLYELSFTLTEVKV